jgi:hypothetical protein
MHTAQGAQGRGVGRALVDHINRGCARSWLGTRPAPPNDAHETPASPSKGVALAANRGAPAADEKQLRDLGAS